MTYTLRDRSDGMVEIILSRPVFVGLFPERDTAEKICAYLNDAEIEPIPLAGPAPADVDDDPVDDLTDTDFEPEQPVRKSVRRAQLPAVIAQKPRAPVALQDDGAPLSAEEIWSAFARIQNGEKLHVVAPDFDLTMGQLRGRWAAYKKHMQKYIAEGGQQPCKHCQRPFTPSISNPDMCARCSK